MKKLLLKILVISFLSFNALLIAPPVLAATCPEPIDWLKKVGIAEGYLIPRVCICGTVNTGCGLEQIVQTIINVATIIVGITGSVALLMFLYGGVMMIIAAGNQERVQKSKQILVAGAVGVVIIFTAWMIVNFVILALTKGEVGNKATLFGQDWFTTQQVGSSKTK